MRTAAVEVDACAVVLYPLCSAHEGLHLVGRELDDEGTVTGLRGKFAISGLQAKEKLLLESKA